MRSCQNLCRSYRNIPKRDCRKTKLRCLSLSMFLVRKGLLIPTISRLEPSMSLYLLFLSIHIYDIFLSICMFVNDLFLNLQLRVSAVLSNSPYILMLDCDMYCNDPTSARQAMCFHFDPQMSSSLAFVQFPQTFHDISKNDIYDSEVRSAYTV